MSDSCGPTNSYDNFQLLSGILVPEGQRFHDGIVTFECDDHERKHRGKGANPANVSGGEYFTENVARYALRVVKCVGQNKGWNHEDAEYQIRGGEIQKQVVHWCGHRRAFPDYEQDHQAVAERVSDDEEGEDRLENVFFVFGHCFPTAG